jgi:hypothetical protein
MDMHWKTIIAAGLIAGTTVQVMAQPPGGVPSGPAPGTTDGTAASRASREQQEGYNRIVNQGVNVTNADDQKGVKKKKAAVPATEADITAGAAVRDKNGVPIATVERLEADGAVVKSGERLAKLPVNAFGKDDAGLLVGITADEFLAAIAQTSVAVATTQEPEIIAATAEDMKPGAAVRDSEGVPIGTVDKLVENGVVVLADGMKVRLKINSFAKDEKGLMIGITASEFKEIINKPAPAKTGS